MSSYQGYKTSNIDKCIRLNANESPNNIYGDSLLDSIKNLDLNRYPELDNKELRKRYADYLGIDVENIIAGNGSDEMLGLILGNEVEPGKKVLTLEPDFSMYDFYTYFSKGQIIKYKLEIDGDFNVEEFIKKGKDEKVDLVIFSNPNNPTGKVIEKEKIEKILRAFKDINVVVDEAYVEFAENNMLDLVFKYDNLIITRTMSKAWGLAALRIGFLITSKATMKKLEKYCVPYNINFISQSMGAAAIENSNIMSDNVKMLKQERDILYKKLKQIQESSKNKVTFVKSQTNFIYGLSPIKESIIKAFEKDGVSIRSWNESNDFRITVGTSEQNEEVVRIMKSVLLGDENE